MAGDIRTFVQRSKLVGEDVKRRFDTADDDMETANRLAVKWLEQAVAAREGDSVGVMVLWCPKPSLSGGNSEPEAAAMEAVFVLVRATMEDGELRVQDIAFGNPLEETVAHTR